MIKLKDLVNERSLVGDEYYGTAYLNYPVRRDGTIDLYRSVEKDAHSSGKKYGTYTLNKLAPTEHDHY